MSSEPRSATGGHAADGVESALPNGAAGEGETVATESPSGADPVRRFTRIMIGVVVVLLVWYVFADRYAPWTDQARIWGFIIPITPKVSGKVKEVNVVENQVVEAGDLLVKIDPREYELAVERAEAALEIAGQDTGADTAGVRAAEATLAKSRAELRQAKLEHERIERIFKEDPGAVSAASRDRAKAALEQAQSQEASAQAELERDKQQLGKGGEDNPRVRGAVAALEQANIDFAETSLYAPSNGGITNLTVDEGYYAKKGTPLMTFVSATDVWVQANLRENSMANVEKGAQVDIALDQLPGRVFKGAVVSKGFAVQRPSSGATGEAMTIKGGSGWLRDAQRFPVIIHFADESAYGYRLAGGQADVQIYGDSAILNALGWVWIRLMSFLSFIY